MSITYSGCQKVGPYRTPRVGMFSVSAVGKTTLQREVLSRRQPEDKWLSSDEALKRVEESTRVCGFEGEWAPVLSFCHQVFTRNRAQFDDKSIRFILMHLLRTARIEAGWLPNVTLFEEDPALRGLSLIMRQPDNESMAFKFLELCPAPVGLVYLWAEAERILERSLRRKKMLSIYAGLDNDALIKRITQALGVVSRMVDVLAERGVRILRLDSDSGIEANADNTASFLSALQEDFLIP